MPIFFHRIPILIALLLLGCSSSHPEESPGRVVVGAPDDPLVLPFLSLLAPGVAIEEGDWVIGGHHFGLEGALLAARFEAPGGYPVALAVSVDPVRLEGVGERLVPTGRPRLELTRLGTTVLDARLTPAGRLVPESLEATPIQVGKLPGRHRGVTFLREPEVEEAWVQAYIERLLARLERQGGTARLGRPLRLVALAQLGPHEPLARYDAPSGTLFVALTAEGGDGGDALVAALEGKDPPPLPSADQSPAGGRRLFQEPWGTDATWVEAYVPAREGPGGVGLWRHDDVTLGGDAALLFAIRRAHSEGRRVAVQVNLLASPSGTFDADRVLTTADQWREHFEALTKAVREVGRLAQAGQADLFVIGEASPRAAATLWKGEGEEDPGGAKRRAARAEGWAAVIAAARECFDGPIGLALPQGPRLETVGFWDQLDVALLEPVPPPSADPDSLRSRLRGALTRARAWGREEGLAVLLLARSFDPPRREALVRAFLALDDPPAGILLP